MRRMMFFILPFCFFQYIWAQNYNLSGQKDIHFEAGMLYNGLRSNIGYDVRLTSKINYSPSILYMFGKEGFTNFNYILIGNGLDYTSVQVRNRMFISQGANIFFGLEPISSRVIEKTDVFFTYGYGVNIRIGIRSGSSMVYLMPCYNQLLKYKVLKSFLAFSIGYKKQL